jgi:hypothetical protein
LNLIDIPALYAAQSGGVNVNCLKSERFEIPNGKRSALDTRRQSRMNAALRV